VRFCTPGFKGGRVIDAAARESKKIERRAVKRTRVARNAKIIVPRRSPVIFLHGRKHHQRRSVPQACEHVWLAGDF